MDYCKYVKDLWVALHHGLFSDEQSILSKNRQPIPCDESEWSLYWKTDMQDSRTGPKIGEQNFHMMTRLLASTVTVHSTTHMVMVLCQY